ncbi:MAG: ATP-dependent DNA helicase [Candidatus Microsaccharimonas sp.]
MGFETRYSQLNDAQKQAVDTIDGPVMIVAGPGTGKTELLSVRIANILKKTDTLPSNILCLTFTESGAQAMRQRLVDIIGKDAYKVAIHTFHSFGSDVINQNREYFYNNALFEPADELRQYEILRGIFDTLDKNKNPLASMMNGEYTYLNDAKTTISQLKRNSALTSDELLAVIQQGEESLDIVERLVVPILEQGIKKTTAPALEAVWGEIASAAVEAESLYGITPLIRVMSDSLGAALQEAQTIHPTKPITAWKNRWLERNEQKQLVGKDRKRFNKLKALSYIYYEYLSAMEKASLFDYDDMIMQVVHAIEVHEDLKFNLQEKYLYFMIDEFQDTNVAQMRILHNLTDNPVNEGSPNILVVGDDDQAVYGFQGADISNILNFDSVYPQAKRIVLTDNYRSGPTILAASRTVIQQGEDRLEYRFPELNKALLSHSSTPDSVTLFQAPAPHSERHWLVNDIKRRLDAGEAPNEIAVLARRHAEIQSLLPYFNRYNIAVRYEREDNVLEQPPIILLEQTARVIVDLATGNHDSVNTHLPALLAHPAWGIAPLDLWKLSLNAHDAHQSWMATMETTPAFESIHTWLVERAAESIHTPLEPMLDRIIGQSEGYTSPLFDYFFATKQLEDHPQEYLLYLEALRTIRSKLREHRPGVTLTLLEFVECIALYRRLGITLGATSYSLASDIPAVQLLTAHKSKGLEFNTVYVFNGVDSTWGHTARSRGSTISYPENLRFEPAGNSSDERLRLFYVAMTRARHDLIISFSDRNDGDKATLMADFLQETAIEPVATPTAGDTEQIEAVELAWYQPLIETTQDLKSLLAPQLEHFKLSATSLNSFLDISRGGPQHFLLNNLLHFPSAKSASASYGTAVHRAMQQAHVHLNATKEQKPLEDILRDFEIALENQRLAPEDFATFLQKGSDQISAFVRSGELPFMPTQKAELSFGHQDVYVDDARLTGSLDMVDIDEQERQMVVTDYKTGHPSESWSRGDERTKMKLHRYRQQLLFYKLLVENSRDYGQYNVTSGQLAFIEPTLAGQVIILKNEFDDEEIVRTKKLIVAVWKRIINLDLPDVSGYAPTMTDLIQFENDLIDGLV